MTTLREWFRDFEAKTNETPTHVVFGEVGSWQEAYWGPIPAGLVDFSALEPRILDTQFDAGYGGTESPNLCAWSQSWVIFSDNYDGSEDPRWVPRDPRDHEPIRPGGG